MSPNRDDSEASGCRNPTDPLPTIRGAWRGKSSLADGRHPCAFSVCDQSELSGLLHGFGALGPMRKSAGCVEGFLSLRIKLVEVALHVSYTFATVGVSCPHSAASSWCSTGRIRKRDSRTHGCQGLCAANPSGPRTWDKAAQFQSLGSRGSNASLGRPEFACEPSGLVGLDRVRNRGHRLLTVALAAFKGPKLEPVIRRLNGPKLHACLAPPAAWALYRKKAGEWIR
jgi:hypothetical protein